jgi:steroid delta-isomerase-like uncharacterized protein
MKPSEMDRLIEQHLAAEAAGDAAASVTMYTEDVEHDVVGFPTGPIQGKAAAQGFYEYLSENIETETMTPLHSYYSEDSCVVEHEWTGTVPGEFLGVAGHGKRITFRLLHVWEFRDGLISRENVWLDGASVIGQLSAPDLATTTA